ncbi:MAG: hypothetical protein CL912_12815 [Deltaproteobacteria bacterium]|nr:hypothetical protein [Deltaproteobacteria bacterium]
MSFIVASYLFSGTKKAEKPKKGKKEKNIHTEEEAHKSTHLQISPLSDETIYRQGPSTNRWGSSPIGLRFRVAVGVSNHFLPIIISSL